MPHPGGTLISICGSKIWEKLNPVWLTKWCRIQFCNMVSFCILSWLLQNLTKTWLELTRHFCFLRDLNEWMSLQSQEIVQWGLQVCPETRGCNVGQVLGLPLVDLLDSVSRVCVCVCVRLRACARACMCVFACVCVCALVMYIPMSCNYSRDPAAVLHVSWK